MPPSRRDFLRSSRLALAGLVTSGCLEDADRVATTPTDATTPRTDAPATATPEPPSPTRSPEPTAMTPTDTPTAEERIMVALHNERDTEVTVSVTVVAGSEQLTDAERTLPAGGYEAVFSGIRDEGEYDITVETADGLSESYEFTIEEWDVRMGSNVVVWLGDDEMEFAMEE
jgi:hypothetical protein